MTVFTHSLPSHTTNGTNGDGHVLNRADEVADLLTTIQGLIVPFIRAADEDAGTKETGHGLQIRGGGPRTVLVEHHAPQKLQKLLDVRLPETGTGKDGLVEMVERILQYSVNTWDQGFMDKLYASTNAVGLASDLLLATLNTNLHVYQVSPALTLIEKHTSHALAALFGYTASNNPHAGGISQPGGSAANQTSIVIARNNLFPETKSDGLGNKRFVLFTSAHGHYSLEKAAQMFGFGSNAVRSIPVDSGGRMIPSALDAAIKTAKEAGETPFYVNATAGTTVLGSYDPIPEIADVCQEHGLWLHIDGSWGGPVVFSETQRWRVRGAERADSIGVTPHKMLGVPLTCSFLLGRDMRQFQKAMTLPAGYLFHDADDEEKDRSAADTGTKDAHPGLESSAKEVWDLADLTPQCGRRGDSLKMALGWTYYGRAGYESLIDKAFDAAAYLAELIASNPAFHLVSERPPPCLQVCFYYKGKDGGDLADAKGNSRTTEEIAKKLLVRGFMIDYAPGERGRFFRVVVNGETRRETCRGLVKAIEEKDSLLLECLTAGGLEFRQITKLPRSPLPLPPVPLCDPSRALKTPSMARNKLKPHATVKHHLSSSQLPSPHHLETPVMADTGPGTLRSPKRKRTNSSPISLPEPLRIASLTGLKEERLDGSESPRTLVAEQMEVLKIEGVPVAVAEFSLDTVRQEPTSKKPKHRPALKNVLQDDSMGAAKGESGTHGKGISTPRRVGKAGPSQSLKPQPPALLEIGETPECRHRPPSSPPLSPVGLADTLPERTASPVQTAKQAAPSTPPSAPLTSPTHAPSRPISPLDLDQKLDPTLTPPLPHTFPAFAPTRFDLDPVPDLATLVWQDSEITGHNVDPSPDDDGEGINGIGFKPTPAIAAARIVKRRRQVKEWRDREAREARMRRMEKRRGEVGGAGAGAGRRCGGGETGGMGSGEVVRRAVRFA
ncbi:Glutamate decarboxylase 2 [Elasticomyces elasticus]|nr:Glutamate decarboxylase 2 [Elasticomyces elasticus]